MSRRINVGVVGCGYWGPNLIRNFRALPDCHLKMMCDLSPSRLNSLKALYADVEPETNFDHMLNGVGLDAVVVATSVKSHFPMAKAALLAGKHVMIEKPMAASAAQCEELNDIAQKNGLVLMVGHTFLYSPAVNKIKEIVDHGDLGEIRYICARRLNLGLYQKDINVAWDLAPHDISIILHLLQRVPESVNCSGSAHITPGIEDVTAMSLNFSKDCSAIIHSSWLDPRKVREMTIVGSKRMILYDDVAPLEKVRIYDARVERPPHYDTFAEFQYAYHYGDIFSPYLKQEEPLKTECLHFLECIRESKTPLSFGARGLEVVKILEASSASLKLRGAAVPFVNLPSSLSPETHAHHRGAHALSNLLPDYAQERAAGVESAPLLRPASFLPQFRLHHGDSLARSVAAWFDQQSQDGPIHPRPVKATTEIEYEVHGVDSSGVPDLPRS